MLNHVFIASNSCSLSLLRLSVDDFQAMVRRFQQKEENYTTLLATVSSSEARVDALKKENEELTARMQELQI